MNKEQVLQLNIEKVIADKNPKLLKVIPRFIIAYLKRIIHQDEINDFLRKADGKEGLDFSRFILQDFNITCISKGLENIPKDGRYLFAANHPLGGMDGIAFLTTVGERFPNIKFPVNDILLHLKSLNNIFLPINKHGGHSRSAFKAIEKAYESDAQILMFPAGLVSRKQKKVIKDLEWKKNFVKKAIQHKRDIVPIHITGENSNFFYGLANWRKRLGIKINLEMLYLVDELYKQRGKTIAIEFGSPIPWQSLDKSKSHEQWAEEIKETVYKLA